MAEQNQAEDEGGLEFHPNYEEDNGLFCFLDGSRSCGPDCMAFTVPTAPTPTSVLSGQQKNCLLLSSLEQIPRFIGGGVSLVKKQIEDKRRSEHKPPPSPLGKS